MGKIRKVTEEEKEWGECIYIRHGSQLTLPDHSNQKRLSYTRHLE